MKKNCLFCSKEFEAQRSTAKFDTPKCKLDYNRGHSTPKNSVSDNSSNDTVIPPSVTDQDKRIKKINALLAEKGLPPVVRASELPKLEFVPSGIPEIDELTGGFPRGRITEIYGMQGVGKSSLMLQILKRIPELKIYYVDAESAVSSHYHGNSQNVEFEEEYLLEKVAESVEVVIQSNFYDLIIVDSVANLIPWAEMEGASGDAHMGLKARLMGQWMRKLTPYLHKSKAAIVFINQQRETMNMYGPAKTTPGGHALPFAASLRLELKTTKADRKDWGHWVNFEITKSKVCKPYQKSRFKLEYQ